jgi:parallel beta-helix repeat protein
MKKAVSTTFSRRTNALLACSAAVLLAAVGADASAQTPSTSIYHLYVSPTGSDSNTGSSSSPFKTISKAAAVAKPGTTVHVAPGTYYGNVATKTSGTSTNPIIFLSTTNWGAKVVGSGTEAMWTNNGNYVQIVGFDITGPGRLGILNYASNTLVAGNHIHNLTLSGGCTGSGGAGVVNATYSGSNGDVIGNVVHDIGTPGGCNGVQGIYSSNAGGKIMNNIVYRVSAYGIHLWHAASGTIIANNTVFANGSTGMGGGIVTGVGDSPGGVQLVNTKVVNNIVYNNPRASIMQYCYSGVSCIGSGNVVANNLVYGNGQGISMKVGSATNTVSANPQFVSYNPTGTGDYRLQSTSPAINKGTSNWAPATDFLGAARPSGGAFDIGAYEMGASSTTGTTGTTGTDTWTYCASEGSTCSFSGTRQVRYGANGQYAYKTFTSSVYCSNSVFGDPIHGVAKTCSYASTAQ